MPAFNFFDQFKEDLTEGVHNFTSDSTCTLTVALCNAANPPSASGDAVLADLTQIAYTNLSARVLTVTSNAETAGVEKLVLADLVLTAGGGPVAPFRYVVIYNDDPTSPADPLVGWCDYGSDLTLADGETFTIDFSAANGLFQLDG